MFRAQPLFPPPLPQERVEEHKPGMFAARCFNLMCRKSSPARRQLPINDLEAAAVRPSSAAKIQQPRSLSPNGPEPCFPGRDC